MLLSLKVHINAFWPSGAADHSQQFQAEASKQTTAPHLHHLFCKNNVAAALRHQHAGSSHRLDLLLGPSAEELGLDDHGLLGQFAFAENFVVTLQTHGATQVNPEAAKQQFLWTHPRTTRGP